MTAPSASDAPTLRTKLETAVEVGGRLHPSVRAVLAKRARRIVFRTQAHRRRLAAKGEGTTR